MYVSAFMLNAVAAFALVAHGGEEVQRTHALLPKLGLGARHRGFVELSARVVLESDWSDSARAVLVTLSRLSWCEL